MKVLGLCQEGTLFNLLELSFNSTMQNHLEKQSAHAQQNFLLFCSANSPEGVSTEHITNISSCWRMGIWMASMGVVPCALHSPTFQPCELVAISLDEKISGWKERGLGQRQLRERVEKMPELARKTMIPMWLSRPLRIQICCVSVIPQSERQARRKKFASEALDYWCCGNSLCFLKWNIAEFWMGKKCRFWVLEEKVRGRCVSMDLNGKFLKLKKRVYLKHCFLVGSSVKTEKTGQSWPKPRF